MNDYQEMTQDEFRAEVMSFSDKYEKDLLENFISYWTEIIIKGRDKGKMKFQGQETWSTSGRLGRFHYNQKQWYGNKHANTEAGKILTEAGKGDFGRL